MKARILEVAMDLFNQESWSSVSLRKIAATLGMSDGNLRYHFRTKEEIVLAIFTQMATQLTYEVEEASRELDDLTESFRTFFRIMYQYRFLFVESYFIKRAYPTYRLLFEQLQASRRDLFLEEFNRLKGEGKLSDAFPEAQYEMLFEQMFILSDSWIKYLPDPEELDLEAEVDYYAQMCNALIVPYII